MKSTNSSTSKQAPTLRNTSSLSHLCLFVKCTLVLLLTFTLSTPIYAAVTEEQLDIFDASGIYYWNPTGSDRCTSVSTTLRGANLVEKAWNFFIEQGFNDAQIAGILGNAQAESGFSPTRSTTGSHWGFFQWGGGRKDTLYSKISAAGLDQYLDSAYWPAGAHESIPAADLDRLLLIQLEHTMSETDMNWQDEIRTANTPEEAAEIFLTLFERATGGDSEIIYYAPFLGLLYQHSARRREYAVDIFKQYSGNGASIAGNCSIIGEFTDLVISYAWPQHHSAPFTDRRPAYAQAVKLSQSEGRYVGGSVNGIPGIDCGGFVTILTQNSGLEPNYNNVAGATPSQEKWAIDNGWTLINNTASTPVDTSLLQAGDIAFSGGTSYTSNKHTFIYVGNIPGFDSVIASASFSATGSSARAPMAGTEDLIFSEGNPVRWYRKN